MKSSRGLVHGKLLKASSLTDHFFNGRFFFCHCPDNKFMQCIKRTKGKGFCLRMENIIPKIDMLGWEMFEE